MTFHLFIAAFVGAAATLVSLVSCVNVFLANKWSWDSLGTAMLKGKKIDC